MMVHRPRVPALVSCAPGLQNPFTFKEQDRAPTLAKKRSASEAVTAEESSLLSRQSFANLAPSISSVCCSTAMALGYAFLS